MNIHTVLQIVIALTGPFGVAAAIAGAQGHRRIYRVGIVVALIGQPAWVYETWQARQLAMFGISALYTLVWLWAAYKEFARPHPHPPDH